MRALSVYSKQKRRVIIRQPLRSSPLTDTFGHLDDFAAQTEPTALNSYVREHWLYRRNHHRVEIDYNRSRFPFLYDTQKLIKNRRVREFRFPGHQHEPNRKRLKYFGNQIPFNDDVDHARKNTHRVYVYAENSQQRHTTLLEDQIDRQMLKRKCRSSSEYTEIVTR